MSISSFVERKLIPEDLEYLDREKFDDISKVDFERLINAGYAKAMSEVLELLNMEWELSH